MKRSVLFIVSVLVVVLSSSGQSTSKTVNRADKSDQDQTVLAVGDVAASNLTEAESAQLMEDPKYIAPEPAAKEKVTQPGILFFKNSDGTDGLTFDWTIGQHARSLLESLRISIYRYQAGKPNPAGVIGLDQAVQVWPKLRRIFCREYPAVRYIDLQGQIQFCEGKVH